MAGQPTIPIEEVERRAREVWGDVFTEMKCRARKGRSERITFMIRGGGSISMTANSTRDPDAVRKGVLDFLASCEKNMKELRCQELIDKIQD